MSESWWKSVEGELLAQGDLLPDCCLPVFDKLVPREGASGASGEQDEQDIVVLSQRLIVVTQSCDLENNKVVFVALCPIYKLDEFAVSNPKYNNTKNWDIVRSGRAHKLHMIASTDSQKTNMDSFVVDFGQIVSLPIEYLSDHARSLGPRWRLNSPFLEHFSQAFARFFMRVGLPSSIDKFK